ncbi:MAG TPA: hypothetical protein VF665_16280 [Longimicrobium sp.]|uniref:hypothetical protein n=1 Tax=Longimicrobium sp. TaxID=2029185 RepID=UPI002ED8963B
MSSQISLADPKRSIDSPVGDLLREELLRFRDDKFETRRGRSLLVSGHRGAGKTYLIERTLNELAGHETRRFLRVNIHGPTLLGGATAQPAPAGKQPNTAGARPDDPMVKAALEQIVLALYRALVDEVANQYRERVQERIEAQDAPSGRWRRRLGRLVLRAGAPSDNEEESAPAAGPLLAAGEAGTARAADPAAAKRAARRHQGLLERAAQLTLELDEYPGADRLRDYWAAGGFLQSGVLFPSREGAPRPNDQGLRELVALSTACEVYRRISGIFPTISENQRLGGSQKQELSAGADTTGHNLLAPGLSLLTGLVTGAGLLTKAATSPVGGLLAGFAAAAGASLVLKLSSGRTRERSYTREYTFVPDRSVATLDRVLPALIRRLELAGLDPVFVVDELDKVKCLPSRMADIVRHLKKFVSEQAFFCFLTDRSYFEYITRQSVEEVYPIEHTYFTDRLFVVFRPESLHEYVAGWLRKPEMLDETEDRIATSDCAALPYVILQRAEMHAIDLQRELREIRGPGGAVSIPAGAVRSETRGRCDIMIQLGIHMVLHRQRNLLEREPELTRLAYDALFYPVRERKAGKYVLDLTDTSGRDAFAEYMSGRMVSAASDPDVLYRDVALGEPDVRFLFELVRDLAELLSNPYSFLDELANWESETGQKLDIGVRESLPLTLGTGPLLDQGAPRVYSWGYDHLGRPVGTRGRSALAYQLELKIRLAMEMVLKPKGGNFSPARQREIRAAIWAVVRGWRSGETSVVITGLAEPGAGAARTSGSAIAEELARFCRRLAAEDTFTTRLTRDEWAAAYEPIVRSFKPHSPIMRGSGSSFQWCFDASGVPLLPDVEAPPHTEEQPWQLQEAFITSVNGALNAVTGGEVNLELLATHKILPASPEWVAVTRALSALHNAARFRRPLPQDHLEVVRAYTALLEQNGEAIALALSCAWVLEGAIPGSGGVNGLNGALRLLAERAVSSPASTLETLQALMAEVRNRIGGPRAGAPFTPVPLLGPDLAAWEGWVRGARSALAHGPAGLEPAAARARLWAAWHRLMQQPAEVPGELPLSMDYLVCEAAWPGLTPPLRLAELTAQAWTDLLVRALADTVPEDPLHVPTWVCIPAAGALGLGSQLRDLIGGLQAMPEWPYANRPQEKDRDASRTLAAWNAAPRFPRERCVLLAVDTEEEAGRWAALPTTGGAAVLAGVERWGMLAHAPRWVQTRLLAEVGHVLASPEAYERIQNDIHYLAEGAPEGFEPPRVHMLGEFGEIPADSADSPALDRVIETLDPAVAPPAAPSPYARFAAAFGSRLPAELRTFLALPQRSRRVVLTVEHRAPRLMRILGLRLPEKNDAAVYLYHGRSVAGESETFELAGLLSAPQYRGVHVIEDAQFIHEQGGTQVVFDVAPSGDRVVFRQRSITSNATGLRGFLLRDPFLGPRFSAELLDRQNNRWSVQVECRALGLVAARFTLVFLPDDMSTRPAAAARRR